MTTVLLTLPELSVKLGVSVEQCKQYRKMGMPYSEQRGRAYFYNGDECINWKIKNVKSSNRKKPIPPNNDNPPNEIDLNDPNTIEILTKAETLRLKKVQADIKELEYQENLGLLISADDAIKLFQQEILIFKAAIEQLPFKLAPMLYTVNTIDGCKNILIKEVEECLNKITYQYKSEKQLSKDLRKVVDYKDIEE